MAPYFLGLSSGIFKIIAYLLLAKIKEFQGSLTVYFWLKSSVMVNFFKTPKMSALVPFSYKLFLTTSGHIVILNETPN